MSDWAVRMRRRAAAFAGTEGAVSVDWVVITTAVVVTGLSIVYFVLGPEGGFFGVVDALSRVFDTASSNLEGAASEGARGVPGGGNGGED